MSQRCLKRMVCSIFSISLLISIHSFQPLPDPADCWPQLWGVDNILEYCFLLGSFIVSIPAILYIYFQRSGADHGHPLRWVDNNLEYCFLLASTLLSYSTLLFPAIMYIFDQFASFLFQQSCMPFVGKGANQAVSQKGRKNNFLNISIYSVIDI